MHTKTYRTIVLSLLLAVGVTSYIQAQSSHLLTLGVRGGGIALLPQSEQDIRGRMGGTGALDIGYVWYMPVRNIQMGIRTGWILGYDQTTLRGDFVQTYANHDYLGNELQYTTSAQLTGQQLSLTSEIPIMMSLRAKGVVFNVGLSLQSTPWQQSRQQLNAPCIDAFYPAYNVHVTDELITGLIPQDQLSTRYPTGQPTFGIGVGTEIGYEFALPKGQIGVQAFFSCSVWNNYHSTHDIVIGVSPIADSEYPVPDVAITNAAHALINTVHPLSFGVRLYYAFEWSQPKTTHRQSAIHPRGAAHPKSTIHPKKTHPTPSRKQQSIRRH